MAVNPDWLEEIVPEDLRVAFMEHVGRNNDNYRKTLLHATWRPLLEQHILNIFEDVYLPDDTHVDHHVNTAHDTDNLLVWVLLRDHADTITVDNIGVVINNCDDVVAQICFQLGWLEDIYDEFPKLPQYRYSYNGLTWEYRGTRDLIEVGTQWFVRGYYEALYQPRLPGGF